MQFQICIKLYNYKRDFITYNWLFLKHRKNKLVVGCELRNWEADDETREEKEKRMYK